MNDAPLSQIVCVLGSERLTHVEAALNEAVLFAGTKRLKEELGCRALVDSSSGGVRSGQHCSAVANDVVVLVLGCRLVLACAARCQE